MNDVNTNSTTFGKILNDEIKKGFKNQSEFAEKIGVTQATVSRYISGTATPSFHVLQMISKVLNMDLALFNPSNSRRNEENGAIRIPFFYSEVSAGKGLAADNDHEHLYFDEVWLKNQFLLKSVNNIFAVKVKGDSMEPIIQEGDIVFAQRYDDYISSQGVYIVSFNDDFLIKKVQLKSRKIIKLISTNKEYDPIEVDLNNEDTSFKVIAKVVGRINTKSFVNVSL